MLPENRQVIGNAIKLAYREPCPIHTPRSPIVRNRECPPDGPEGMGGRGEDTQGQSTLMLIGKLFMEKEKQQQAQNCPIVRRWALIPLSL